MNLISFAARLAFQYAVIGKTIADQHVLNAPIEPVDFLLKTSNKKPLIAVYTGIVRGNPNGRDLFGAPSEPMTMELVAQVYLPPGDLTFGGVKLNLQDDAAGLAIDFVWRQVQVALANPTDPWAEIFRRLVNSFSGFDSRPVLIEMEGGARIPCREISWLCKTAPEPPIGQPMNQLWQKLDGMMRANTELAPLADVVKGMIEAPADMPSWRQVQALVNWSDPQVRHLGFAPVDATEEDEAADLAGATVYDGDDPPPEPGP